MSLQTRLEALTTRIATEIKAVRSLANGKVGSNGSVVRIEYYTSDAALPATLESGVLYITPDEQAA